MRYGFQEIIVGYLRYQENILAYPPARNGIIGGSVGVIVIVAVVVGGVVYYKMRSADGGGDLVTGAGRRPRRIRSYAPRGTRADRGRFTGPNSLESGSTRRGMNGGFHGMY